MHLAIKNLLIFKYTNHKKITLRPNKGFLKYIAEMQIKILD